MSSRGALLLALALAGVVRAAAGGGEPRPAVSFGSLPGGRITFEARMPIDADPAAVFATVSDYDRLATYMPHVDSSRVVSRDGSRVIVRQCGSTRFLVSRRVALTLEFRESPPGRLDFRTLAGSLDDFQGTWEFLPVAGWASTELVYRATLRSARLIPRALVRRVIRRNVEEMMPAIAREVARRRASGRR